MTAIPAVCVHDDGYEHPSDGTLPCPLAAALSESSRPRERIAALEAEAERLQALVKRMAPAASSYNARIYQVGFEPDIAQHLTDEEIRLNSERPSAADDRARYDAERLREQLEAAESIAKRALGAFDDMRDARDAARAELATAKRDAWQEGYDTGENMAHMYGHVDYWEDEPTNPYLPAASSGVPEDGER